MYRRSNFIIVIMVMFFVGCSCNKPTEVILPTYDSRNVSRNASNSYSGTLCVGADGTVHVVWSDDATGQLKTYYACKTAGGSWSVAVNISGSTTNACSAPQIAIDQFGNLHVVWDELGSVPGSHAMYTNKPVGGSWVVPIDISSPTTVDGSLPQIGIDGTGKVYVIYDGGGGVLFFTIRELSELWSTPIEFQRPFGNPSLAVSNDGQMHVVYENNLHGIMYMHRTSAGAWDSAVDVSRMPAQYCSIADIEVDDAGNVYAAWTDRTASEVYFSKKVIGDTAWSQPLNVSSSSAGSWIPRVVVGSDYIVHFIWAEDIAPGYGDIFYKKELIDSSWTNVINISNTAGDSRISGFVIDGNNKLHVLWTEVPDNEVYYDIYPK
ncbi:MAG: hypothetical protein A2509_12270 [Candidatus Edwardsbacteria bacterium RIFOXYD12_FULL_50_11]|uniref:Uncharacterized protein n=1 Tax=Candidatus Edwardsbacteria bacterium GWF2_54_11 TaxID=1817851 RepID=A0A1F5R1W0_9BACT|nr:MAG: hypothetical protein A2502_02555 [Candidatus Edwardsbacteria bacterium RifOxyC12_full_54_24]OGF08458.1 MAG: hypothetical protein A2024_07065 [Candidatus Edwardsbacteria bacterium GWF2_54_11]OGF09134.1 MAG: hypothetical protein A2273_11010 [Candidatus Edwardsbacteria bacterium RifOxyA12_full_54_48]OGF12342.1 MAG: hypothetical protein A3K15_00585 [Candidatus Edwardsbacteria bacterium GWE2_54_12]OGF15703.1 MAG: hypothetical protein A2509_12270 [Candidatus Edwardsbacteria bacterium RIFOXYD1